MQHGMFVNLMLFDMGIVYFAKRAPKRSINDKFYKHLATAFCRCAKSMFSQRFLMVWRAPLLPKGPCPVSAQNGYYLFS